VSRPDWHLQRQRVAIIGGGVSGALSAARLAERGFEVTLFEKAAIGNGSSSRSMAGIRAQFGVEETVIGMLYSEWWYAHLPEMLDTPIEQRQPAIRQNGYLFLYDRAECSEAALFPPVIYGEGIRRAEQFGARILQRTEVLGGEHHGKRLVALQTSRGVVEADWFVNCTNAWAARVSPRLGGMPLPIVPVKRFLYHLDPGGAALSADTLKSLPMTIYGMGRRLGAHTRPDGQHLILAGTSHTPPEPAFEDEDQDRVPEHFDHRHGVDNFGFELLADMALYAPSLVESGGLVATSCGYYGMTPDAVPLIGYDANISNLVHAAGFSGHGLMHAPVTALLVERLVAGEVSNSRVCLPPPFESHTLDLSAFDPCRDFSRSAAESAVL
jgi:glycine/D-amino acid oxidase-like deaminating enzyme